MKLPKVRNGSERIRTWVQRHTKIRRQIMSSETLVQTRRMRKGKQRKSLIKIKLIWNIRVFSCVL